MERVPVLTRACPAIISAHVWFPSLDSITSFEYSEGICSAHPSIRLSVLHLTWLLRLVILAWRPAADQRRLAIRRTWNHTRPWQDRLHPNRLRCQATPQQLRWRVPYLVPRVSRLPITAEYADGGARRARVDGQRTQLTCCPHATPHARSLGAAGAEGIS